MAATPTIHVVTNAELAAGRELEGLADPERIAPIAPAKRSALLANPYLRGGEDAARLLASVDSRIGGRLDLVAGEIETPDGPVPLFWGSSFYVSPHLRGRGIGSALLRAAEEWRPSAGAAGPSRLSKPLYLRRGYYDVPLRRHVLVRRSRSLVPRCTRWAPPTRPAGRPPGDGKWLARAPIHGWPARCLTARNWWAVTVPHRSWHCCPLTELPDGRTMWWPCGDGCAMG